MRILGVGDIDALLFLLLLPVFFLRAILLVFPWLGHLLLLFLRLALLRTLLFQVSNVGVQLSLYLLLCKIFVGIVNVLPVLSFLFLLRLLFMLPRKQELEGIFFSWDFFLLLHLFFILLSFVALPVLLLPKGNQPIDLLHLNRRTDLELQFGISLLLSLFLGCRVSLRS